MSEFFQNLWSILTTENSELIEYSLLPFYWIEALVSILLFTAIFKVKASRKQLILFVFSLSLLAMIINFLIPTPYSNYLNIVIMPILLIFIFKVSLLKSIAAQISQFLITVLSSSLLMMLFVSVFKISSVQIENTLIYRLSFSFIQYVLMYLLYLYIKKHNLNIDLIDNLKQKTNLSLLFNFFIGIVAIIFHSFIITELSGYIPLAINLASFAILIVYFISNLYNLSRTTKLEKTEQDLEEEKAYNKTITVMYDNIRGFRHDFNNIVQAIGRLCCNRRFRWFVHISFWFARRLPESK